MQTDANSRHARLQRIRTLSRLMDNSLSIPGTKYRFGLDPILGLLPGGGDLASILFSGYIIWEASQLGASRETLTRMASNVIFDTLAGSVPVVGDIFDVTWKANSRNVSLLEDHLQVSSQRPPTTLWFVVVLLLAIAIVFIGIVTFSFLLFSWIFRALGG